MLLESDDWTLRVVQFHHRTAKDFFKNNEEGKRFLSDHSYFPQEPALFRAATCLAGLKLCQMNSSEDELQLQIWRIMYQAQAGYARKANSVALMDYFDHQL